jgi:hypothetical protein
MPLTTDPPPGAAGTATENVALLRFVGFIIRLVRDDSPGAIIVRRQAQYLEDILAAPRVYRKDQGRLLRLSSVKWFATTGPVTPPPTTT